MKSTIGPSNKPQTEVGRALKLLLADESVLYLATRDYQLNVSRPEFPLLHAHFETLYDRISRWIDAIAERARAIGVSVRDSWNNLAATARVAAVPGNGLSARLMVSELLRLHDNLIARLRDALRACGADIGTADLLTGLLRQHEKEAWTLRAHSPTDATLAPGTKGQRTFTG